VLAVASSWLLLPETGLVGAGIGYGIGQAGGLCLAGLFIARGSRRAPRRGGETALADAHRDT
jgi:hypothetical protein